MDQKPTTRARLAAALALALAALTAAAAVYAVIANFPRGLILAALIIGSAIAAWYGLLRRDPARIAGLGAAAALLLPAALIVVLDEGLLELVLVGTGALATIAATKTAFAVRRALGLAPDPARPVLFFNPRSGGGKAERFRLADEARARGYRPVELTPGSDLEQLVRGAIAEGADALAMAGGDGSQAIVAAIAAEHGLPYACIPAGTRNHLALDLGVDRNDAIGALDAFVDGGEIVVDLAEVNGRVFVNNVSLGVYAEAVQQEAYRDAKVRTLVDTVPDALGPEAHAQALSWTDASTGETATSPAMLVSNGRYRLGHAVGSGTRPTLQAGLLGVAVFATERNHRPHLPWREWGTPKFEVQADGPVYAGIDGEAAQLEPPLRFRSVPGVLRVRVAKQHPGASPSADMPKNMGAGAGALVRIALGR